jgi:dephospho-CoA kinase
VKQVSVALTGGIGSGKSTVAELLRNLGAGVVSGDELGRAVLEEDDDVRTKLVEKLGADVMDAHGVLNRKLIAERVFASADLSKWLTDLTFPGIIRRWEEFSRRAIRQVIVFDAALIFEWGIQDRFDVVLTVVSSEASAVSRSNSRFTSEDFQRRRKSQLPDELKIAGADFVLHNDGSPELLRANVIDFWNNTIHPLIS